MRGGVMRRCCVAAMRPCPARQGVMNRGVRSLSTAPSVGLLSTTHKGTAFEKRSLALLEEHLSMSLTRIGGKDDGGIDLLGWWWLPLTYPHEGAIADSEPSEVMPGAVYNGRRRLRVIAQCKDEKRKAGPKYVRELEGVLYRYTAEAHIPQASALASVPLYHSPPHVPIGRDKLKTYHRAVDPVVGLLISSAPFTKASMLRANSSSMPLVLLHIPSIPDSTWPRESEARIEGDQRPDDNGELGSLVFNSALANGLLHNQLQPRWEHPLDNGRGGRPGLWFNGRRVRSWTPEQDRL